MTEKTPLTTPTRRYLPMWSHVKGKRSAVTCALKCNNACLEPDANCSDNHYFKDIVEAAISRRSALGLAGAAVVVGAAASNAPSAQALPIQAQGKALGHAKKAQSSFSFNPIAPVPADVDDLTVPDGFEWAPIIRWGDPLFKNSPQFDINHQTAAAQALQFGYNNDYLTIIPNPNNPKRGVLVCNHEYVNENIMFSEKDWAADKGELRRVAMAAQGLSVVELKRKAVGSPWEYIVGGKRNRRITTSTPFSITGPARGSKLLKTAADPTGSVVLGTNNNCSGGLTPWGTVLSGEENFDSYFVGKDTAEFKRYTIKNKPSVHGWEDVEPRWNANNPGYENESNRFGYIVELDPEDPTAPPRKHTALGRFKHEGANIHVDPKTGEVAAYMGDDTRFEYMYKFVARDRYIEGNRKHNMRLLENGSLYVARFTGDSPAAEIDGSGKLPSDGAFDGTGQWIQLTDGNKSLVPGMSIDEVLVYTRIAADKMNPTKMDRPEDVEPSPFTGKIYAALTNNTDRGTVKDGKQLESATEPNPRNNNRDGHIIEITEDRNRVSSKTFTWDLLLVCGDPAVNEATYFAGFDPTEVSPISCPDNVAFDSQGNPWKSTDGQPGTIQFNDGLFRVGLEGAERGHVEQFLAVPQDAETCGPVIHDQENMVYVSVQHPGEDGSFEEPRSYFPDYANSSVGSRPSAVAKAHGTVAQPRPSVVQVYLTKNK